MKNPHFSESKRARAPFNSASQFDSLETETAHDSHDLVQSLLPLNQRSEREARGNFLIEGLRCVHLALETDCLETLLFAARSPFATLELVREARGRGVHCAPVEDAALSQLAHGKDAQGVIGVAARRPLSLGEAFADEGVWVALESVQESGNLGSILRTCEAAGARGVIAVGAQIDFFAPKVVRASMGAFFSQKLVRATWKEVLDFKLQREIAWFGTCLDGASPYDAIPYPRNFWLWMGDEQAGLSERALQECDARISIPMQGRVDSLNLGVATGIVLYGARRRK